MSFRKGKRMLFQLLRPSVLRTNITEVPRAVPGVGPLPPSMSGVNLLTVAM
jgi:hypothetical protein